MTSEKQAGVSAAEKAEIAALRDETHETRRATVPALEEILYRPIPVLDHLVKIS